MRSLVVVATWILAACSSTPAPGTRDIVLAVDE